MNYLSFDPSIELLIMGGTALSMVVWGLRDSKSIWEAPIWIGFIFLAYLFPQAVYIERVGIGEMFGAWQVWLYISVCLLTFWLTFTIAKKDRSPAYSPRLPLDDNRLLLRGAIVLALGTVSMMQVNQIASSQDLGTQWTGIVTFFYLLFQCVFMAFSIGTIQFVRTRRIPWLAIAGISLFFILVAISSNAKRSLMAEVFFIIAISFYFVKGWRPPRVAIIALMLFGTVLVHQIGAVRMYMQEGRGNAFQALAEGVPFQRFEYFELQRGPEMTQAVVNIHRVNETATLYGPALLWNRLVHQYVPAFLLGRDFKEGLQFNIDQNFGDGLDQYNWAGATETGFSDSYQSYGPFGFLVFGLIGWLMGKLYARAKAGAQWAQYLYMLILNDAMFAVTESTARFFANIVFVIAITVFQYRRTESYRAQQQSKQHNFVTPALGSKPRT